MADYEKRLVAEYAKAAKDKRDAALTEELAAARYENAKKNNAGAGRGKQGGPTAEELRKYSDGGKTDKNIKPFKKGGKISASSRADGVAQRGKTRGKMG
jgi:hypothetical protein